jgi:hypothetical protein
VDVTRVGLLSRVVFGTSELTTVIVAAANGTDSRSRLAVLSCTPHVISILTLGSLARGIRSTAAVLCFVAAPRSIRMLLVKDLVVLVPSPIRFSNHAYSRRSLDSSAQPSAGRRMNLLFHIHRPVRPRSFACNGNPAHRTPFCRVGWGGVGYRAPSCGSDRVS